MSDRRHQLPAFLPMCFSGTGALGTASTAIESVEPFYVEPKLPLEVTSGDVVPPCRYGLVNRTPRAPVRTRRCSSMQRD